MNDVVRRFWKQKASTSAQSVRWTGADMLAVDSRIIKNEIQRMRLNAQANWLDVGSGSGDLQRALDNSYGFCVATDAEPTMAKFYEKMPRTVFFSMPFQAIEGVGDFDIVTAFGLVTYLDKGLEEKLYAQLSRFSPTGTVVVKNQVTDGNPKIVQHYSKEFGLDYFGWYPNLNEQKLALSKHFEFVRIEKYPVDLQIHRDSFHVAFICSNTSWT